MKLIIVLAALVAVALAAPQQRASEAVIVKEEPSNNIGVDGYRYSFETSDGESKQETAELVNAGTENQSLVVRGSYSYVDPATNQRYTVTYTADENGFRPVGDHIPA